MDRDAARRDELVGPRDGSRWRQPTTVRLNHSAWAAGRRALVRWLCLVLAAFLAPCPAAQHRIQAWVTPTGSILLGRGAQLDRWPPRVGGDAPLRIELNAHAPNWLHVPQDDFVVTETGQPSLGKLVVVGELPIPCDPPGVLVASQQVEAVGTNLSAVYDLQAPEELTLCGLQVSVNLDCAAYAGATVELTGLKTVISGRTPPDQLPFGTPPTGTGPVFSDAAPATVTLPLVAPAHWELYSGYCDQLRVTGGTGLPFTLAAQRPMRLIIQDNRLWGIDSYEIRLAFIMQAEGRTVPAGTSFHTAVTLGLGDPVTLELQAP